MRERWLKLIFLTLCISGGLCSYLMNESSNEFVVDCAKIYLVILSCAAIVILIVSECIIKRLIHGRDRSWWEPF